MLGRAVQPALLDPSVLGDQAHRQGPSVRPPLAHLEARLALEAQEGRAALEGLESFENSRLG